MNNGVDLGFDPQSCAGPVDYDEIAFTERIYEFHFDPAYIQFLEQCNGGVPKKRYFPVPGNVKVVERFLCVVTDVSNNERHGWYDMGVVTAQIEDRLSDSQVPFAALFAGDFLCFDAEDADPPKVVVWDHERSGEGSPVTLPVADNFTAFLSLLYGDDEADAEGNRVIA
jgi:hypothetical protein